MVIENLAVHLKRLAPGLLLEFDSGQIAGSIVRCFGVSAALAISSAFHFQFGASASEHLIWSHSWGSLLLQEQGVLRSCGGLKA